MINAEVDPDRAALDAARQAVVEGIAEATARLHWRDFELLVELILTRSGWQRVSAKRKSRVFDLDIGKAQGL